RAGESAAHARSGPRSERKGDRPLTGPSARGGSREPGQFLFDELRSLHRRAGEPSTRTLARRLGVGVLSHSTVHAVLTGPRVPRWAPLELVVRQLGGGVGPF